MKKLLSLLLAFAIVMGVVVSAPFTPVAYASGDELIFTLNSDGQSYSVTGVADTTAGELNIPAVYGEYPVTAIGDSAFNGQAQLTEVTIADGILSIGAKAFYNCTGLKSIVIPDSVTSLGNAAFCGCSALETAVLSENIAAIGGSEFCYCSSLKEITIPAKVTSIGAYAFSGCSALKYIYYAGTQDDWSGVIINSGNTTINNAQIHYEATAHVKADEWNYNGFDCASGESGTAQLKCVYCDYIFEEKTIPAGHSIVNGYCEICKNTDFIFTVANGNATITGYTGTASVLEIPAMLGEYPVTAIGDSAFNGQAQLTEVTIADGILSIGAKAFYNCTGLKSIVIPDSVTSLGNAAFCGCSALETAVLSENIATIGGSEFCYCSNLKEITIPAKVTSIGAYAFSGCSALKYIYYAGTQDDWSGVAINSGNTTINNAIMHYEATAHVGNGIWIYDNYDCTSGLDGERYQLCQYCDEVAVVEEFPAGHILTNGVCDNCGAVIYEYTIENGYAYITRYNGTEAFVTVPDTLGGCAVGVIGDNAFTGNTYIKSVTLPDTVVRIDGNAFAGSELAELKLPDGDITIDFNSFSCWGLSYIELGSGSVTFSDMPASNYFCKDLSIYIPKEHDIKTFMLYLDNCFNNEIYIAEELTVYCELTEEEYLSVTGRESAELPHGTIVFGAKPVVGVYEDFLYKENLNNEIEIFAYTGNQTSITVPAEINNKPVTGIGITFANFTYYLEEIEGHKNYIEEINLPETLKTIDVNAFAGCVNLERINIPHSVTYVGYEAFVATALEAAREESGEEAFYVDTCLVSGEQNTQIKEGTTIIAMYAISADSDSVQIPTSVKAVSDCAFEEADNLKYIFYAGTQEQWGQLSVGEGNSILSTAAIHYEATDHTYGEWSTVTTQDCQTEGVEERICSVCGYTDTKTHPVKGHYFVNDVCTRCSLALENVEIGKLVEPTVLRTGYVQSSHNYSNNTSRTYTFLASGADYVELAFSEDTYVEANYDYIYVYDYNSNLLGTYTGTQLAGVTLTVNDRGVKVKITSDSSNVGYGFYADCTAYKYLCDGEHSHKKLINQSTGDCYNCGYTGDIVCVVCEAVVEEGRETPCEHSYVDNICVNCNAKCFDYYVSEGGAVISSFVGSGESIVIPSMLGGYPVTRIDDGVFEYVNSIKSITIPEGVTSIGYAAFYNCESLAEIYLPESITEIESNAFCNTAFYNDESNWENGALYISNWLIEIKEDFEGAFTVREGTTSFAEYAFDECVYITSIHLPLSVEGLPNSTVIPSVESVTIDENHPDFVSVDGIVFSKDMKTIMWYPAAKEGSTYQIPESVTEIGSLAFACARNLGQVNIHDSVTKIDMGAFAHSSITYLELPDSVTYVGDLAFGYSNLKYIKLSKNIEYMGEEAVHTLESAVIILPKEATGLAKFAICSEGFWGSRIYYSGTEDELEVLLENKQIAYEECFEIHCEAEDPVVFGDEYLYIENSEGGITIIAYTGNETEIDVPSQIDGKAVVSVGRAFSSYYQVLFLESFDYMDEVNGIRKITLPDTITELDELSFVGNVSVEEIVLPFGLAKIGDNAFAYCVKLEEIVLPSGLTKIGYEAFEYCVSLEEITIPDSITSIGDEAFEYCVSLEEITIPDSVTSIGDWAFEGCASLEAITLPDKAMSIGRYAFTYTAYGQNESNWENNVLYIGKHLVDASSSLSGECAVKDGTLTIASDAFSCCESLTSITIPTSVAHIGASAFRECTSLAEIIVDENNASYASADNILFNKAKTELVFYPEAKADTEYAIPEGVKRICDYAFYNCDNLTSIVIPGSVTDISSIAIYYCDNLEYVFYAGTQEQWSSTEIGKNSNNSLGDVIVHYEATGHTMSDEWVCVEGFDCESGNTNTRTKNCTVCDLVMETQEVAAGHKGENGYCEYCNECLYTYTVLGNNATITGYTGNESVLEIPAEIEGYTVVAIDEDAFANCTFITEVTFPETLKTIGSGSFQYCSGITSLTIPDNITHIYYGAFQFCTGLTSVNFGKGLVYIGDSVFYGCRKIATVSIDSDYVMSWFNIAQFRYSTESSYIYDYTHNHTVRNLYIGENVTEINPYNLVPKYYSDMVDVTDAGRIVNIVVDEANDYFSSIDGVLFNKDGTRLIMCQVDNSSATYTIPESVEEIGEYAFAYANVGTLNIHSDVKRFKENAFAYTYEYEDSWDYYHYVYYSTNIATLYIESLADWLETEFESYTANPVVYADQVIFGDYTGTSVVVPESVENIGAYAFSGMDITGLTISENVKSVDEDALSGVAENITTLEILSKDVDTTAIINECQSIESLKIGEGVEFDVEALASCSSLVTLIVAEEHQTLSAQDGVLFNKDKTKLLFYPAGKTGSYSIPSTVEEIATEAFGVANISTLYLPASVKKVEDKAFAQYYSDVWYDEYYYEVTSNAVIGTVRIASIEAWCNIDFECDGNEEFSVYTTPMTVADSVVFDDTDNAHPVVPDTITELKPLVFANSSFTAITLPDGLKTIGEKAFINNDYLVSVELPDSVELVGEQAFRNCDAITEVNTGNSAESILSEAFAYCGSLETVRIGSGVKHIGTDAFEECSPSSLYIEDIASWCAIELATEYSSPAYEGNSTIYIDGVELTDELIIPEGVTSINSYAFAGFGTHSSGNIKKISFPTTVTNIEENAFDSLGGIQEITVNNNYVINNLDGELFACCGSTERINNALEVINIGAMVDDIDIEGLSRFSVHESMWYEYDESPFFRGYNVSEDNAAYSSKDGVLFNKAATKLLRYDIAREQCYSIPDTVTEVGEGAFFYRKGLTSVTIPDSVRTIGARAFYECSGLAEVRLGNSVESIGNNAFLGSPVTELYIEDIASWCAIEFATSCSNPAYDNNPTIYIAGEEFSGELIIPEGVKTINDYAFYGWPLGVSLSDFSTVKLSFPSTIEHIGDVAFRTLSAVTELTINNDYVLDYLDDRSLLEAYISTSYYDEYYVKLITTVNLGEKVENISVDALKEFVHSSNSVSEFELPAFQGFNVSESNPNYSSQNGVVFNKDKTTIIYYPIIDSDVDYTIPSTVTEIGEGAFTDCAINNLYFSESIKKVNEAWSRGDYFEYGYYNNIQNIYAGSIVNWCNIEFTSNRANPLYDNDGWGSYNVIFSDASLKNLVIPSGVTEIKDNLFAYCDEIETVTICDGVESIGQNAFRYCDNLTSVDIAGSVKVVGRNAFRYCRSLNDVTLHPGTEKLDHYAFADTDLIEILIPKSVTYISRYAFTAVEVIKGALGSYAQEYADKLVYDFVVCEHDYVDSVCTICGARIPKTGLLTVASGEVVIDEERLLIISANDEISDSSQLYSSDEQISTVISADAGFYGTGAKVSVIENNEEVCDYTLIITGDVNGDGVCDVLDSAQVALIANEKKYTDDVTFLAADTNDDGCIDVFDYQTVANTAIS